MQKTLDKLRRGEHVTIVCLGDSNTELTFHTAGRLNWVGLLSEAIFEAYGNGVCTMINAGKCASSFREALTRLDRDALRFKPDLAILSFGMNDAGAGLDGLPTFVADARRCVETLRAAGAEVLLRTSNPVVGTNGLPLPDGARPGVALEFGTRRVREYAAALVELAREIDCPVVDHYTLWTQRQFSVRHGVADPNRLWPRMSDAIHPGAQGHLAFYRELAPLFDLPWFFPWEQAE
ncbi:MAG: SGNH/GDSL hydrolase family protein [Planctomycetota bacterium]|nr:SGNH/GDSL hydrolase family protein [Planctomycetota bacterium]